VDRLTSMAVFVRVAEKRSFTAVADEFDLSSTMVANHIRALEAQIGARLLETTTRRQTLTEVGTAYLERCRDVLASVQAADQVAESLQAEPRGRLRVTAPITWGTYRLIPVIAAYMAAHPQVEVEVDLNDRVVDLGDEGFDCAVRSGRVADARIVARALQPSRMLAAASPAYLASRGTPGHPSDLASHALLFFTEWRGNRTWRFTRESETVAVDVKGPLTVNNGQALMNAALGGAGVVVQPDALLEPSINAGTLVHVLADWKLPARPMHLVRLPNTRPSAKVRSFTDFVVSRLA
jgi:DNA-binding transcriptional LysR family regulator